MLLLLGGDTGISLPTPGIFVRWSKKYSPFPFSVEGGEVWKVWCLFYAAAYFSIAYSTNIWIATLRCPPDLLSSTPGIQENKSHILYLVKVDESVQTTGQEVIAAPTDLWDTKPASAEYWYKKKGNVDTMRAGLKALFKSCTMIIFHSHANVKSQYDVRVFIN